MYINNKSKEHFDFDTMFALFNGKLIHINEVTKELKKSNKDSFFCPKCGEVLTVRLGNKRKHHFAHRSDTTCIGNGETALHLFAKEVLKEHTSIITPVLNSYYFVEDYELTYYLNNNIEDYHWTVVSFKENDIHKIADSKEVVFENKKRFKYNKVYFEQKLEDIIADAVVVNDNDDILIIEFRVTYEVDNEKIKKIKKLKFNCIEINLIEAIKKYCIENNLEISPYNFNREYVKNIIVNSTKFSNWVFNNRLSDYKKAFKIKADVELLKLKEKEEQEHQKVIQHYQNKRKKKIERLKLLSDKQYLNKLKSKWSKELPYHPKWKRISKLLGYTIDTLPEFLNIEIEGEHVFLCDRRLWQSTIYYVFIHQWDSKKSPISTISIKYLVDWIKKKTDLPIDWNLVYTKDVNDYFEDVKSLADVLWEYFMRLYDYGLVRPSERSLKLNGNPYYWVFEKAPQKNKESDLETTTNNTDSDMIYFNLIITDKKTLSDKFLFERGYKKIDNKFIKTLPNIQLESELNLLLKLDTIHYELKLVDN